MTFKKVYLNGSELSVKDIVLEQMGLCSGQEITEDQAWKAMELSTAAFVAEMDMYRISGEPNIPDCTRIKASLARIRRESD
jgi:hypothetical protein